MLRAVLFDVDGTLVDSNNYHVLAWAEAFHAAGHDFRLQQLHQQIGKGSDNYVRALLPDVGEEEAERLADAHGRLFRQHYAHRLQAFPGARDLLERCKREGLTTWLATSASGPELDRHLEVLDARDLVDGWTGADDVAHSKPCPDIFQAALSQAQLLPEQAIAIGDTPYDIEAAQRAGMQAIAVRSGLFSNSALHGALTVYDDVADLLARFDDSPLSRVSEQA